MRVHLWSRYSSYMQRFDTSRQESDGQPLIHQIPAATDPPATIAKTRDPSGVHDVLREPVNFGAYTLLDNQSKEHSDMTTKGPMTGRLDAINALISRHKLFLGCLLPLFSVLFELTMLSIFLYIYLSLPLDPKTETRRRISPQYSMWPFISCVGSTTLTVFRALSFAIVICSITAATLLFYFNYNVGPGYWLRRLQLLQTLTANAFLIWLVFASENNTTYLHRYIVSLRLLFLFGAKCTAWLVAFAMRTAYPLLKDDRASRMSFHCKTVLMPLAFAMAAAANAGVFVCQDPTQIQEKGTTCYSLIAAAAVSDWCYSTVNTAFMLVMASDLYYDEHYGRVRKGLPTPKPS